MKFFIIVTGYNCQAYVEKCYDSIMGQTCKDFTVVFYNDGSTDNTHEKILGLKEINYLKSDINMGAAYGRDLAIKTYNPDQEDIICFVGMDDQLFPYTLERVKHEYEKGKWMTYGNWVNQYGDGLPANFDLEFPDDIHTSRDYRKVTFRSTCLNTFKRFLYNAIKPDDLKMNGEWVKATTESEVMFSCLEQCGKEKIGLIKDYIYLYTQVVGGAARSRFGVEYQNKIYNNVINRTKRDVFKKT